MISSERVCILRVFISQPGALCTSQWSTKGNSGSAEWTHLEDGTNELMEACSCCVLFGATLVQVVVWDTRAKSLPVQRTPLSATGHTYPVYNLHIGGEAGAPSRTLTSSII